MKLILKYLWESVKTFPKLFNISFLLAVINTLIQAVMPLGLKFYLEYLGVKASDKLVFIGGLLVYATILLISNIVDVIWYRSLDDFGGSYIKTLTVSLENKIAKAYGNEIDKIGREKIHHTIYNDVLDVFRVIGHHSPSLISSLAIVLVSLLVSAYYNAKITVILFIVFIIGVIIANKTRQIITGASTKINSKMKCHSAVCEEFANQIDMVQSNNIVDYYDNKTVDAIQDFIQTAKELDKKQVFFSNLLNSINAIFSLALAALLSVNPNNSLVDLVFIMAITSIIVSNAARVDQLYFRILTSFGSFQQIELLRNLTERDGEQCLEGIDSVEFFEVSFAYYGAENSVVKDTSFILEKGDCVRVNAPNGAGKSTIFKLLQGVYAPSSGEVRLNGTPINLYSQESINKEILYIGQNFGFINDTVAKYFKLFTGVDIEKCSSDSSYLKLLEGLTPNKIIGRDGSNLSFGQRKKIQLCMLLSLIESPSLVILDEVDAGLDTDGLKYFSERINEIVKQSNKIILFVQHGETTNIKHNKTIDGTRKFICHRLCRS